MTRTTTGDHFPLTPSGEQFEISHGEQHATVGEVGGGLRRYSIGGPEPAPAGTAPVIIPT